MTQYKYPQFLTQSNHGLYDTSHPPGTLLPSAGLTGVRDAVMRQPCRQTTCYRMTTFTPILASQSMEACGCPRYYRQLGFDAMDLDAIVQGIDSEIERLKRVRALLSEPQLRLSVGRSAQKRTGEDGRCAEKEVGSAPQRPAIRTLPRLLTPREA